MKTLILLFCCLSSLSLFSQENQPFVHREPIDTSQQKLNMDAVYNRPFLEFGKIPVALGGYMEMHGQYMGTDGISDGFAFKIPRVTLFVSSTIHRRIKFLTEIEFESGTKEINIEFASIDLELHPLAILRAGIIMNPIGAFNQNHDSPKWDFIDRPISATQMLPATFSNVGAGMYGKAFSGDWTIAYEVYATNGFDDHVISNGENKTFLPASKDNIHRFEESSNGIPLVTGKIAVKHRKIGELGLSYMGGVYNTFRKDGIRLDAKRRLDVAAIDYMTTLPKIKTRINAEWAFVWVDVPSSYTQQFGTRQHGGYLDFVQPVWTLKMKKRKQPGDFVNSYFSIGCRLEYVDWNVGTFNENGVNIGDDVFAVVPAFSWRPGGQTVFRINYRYEWQRDLLGNAPARTAGFQAGVSSYF
ncbi:MAG: hypothetical protein SFW35_03035 [Chitinophagales bacterium]|nr:hypothetical protein [Chitinophagales bacterium]